MGVGVAIVAGLIAAAAAAGASDSNAQREIPAPPIGADSQGMFYVTYPKASLRLNEQGVVHYRLTVDRDGLPASCTVTQSSGYPRLDQLTCAAAVHHAKFSPPRNAKGFSGRSLYEGNVVWSIR